MQDAQQFILCQTEYMCICIQIYVFIHSLIHSLCIHTYVPYKGHQISLNATFSGLHPVLGA